MAKRTSGRSTSYLEYYVLKAFHLSPMKHVILIKRRRQPTGCLRLIFFSTSYPSIPPKNLEDIGIKCRGMDVIFALTYHGPEKTLKT